MFKLILRFASSTFNFAVGVITKILSAVFKWLASDSSTSNAVLWTVIFSAIGTFVVNYVNYLTSSNVIGWFVALGIYIIYLNVANKKTVS